MPDAFGDPSPETSELRLEPVLFIARVDAVLRLGRLMLGAGASSARVRDSMKRVALALGIDDLHTRVGMTDIVLTAHRGALYRTRVAEVRPGVDAYRITLLQRLSHDVENGTTAHELQRELDAIESARSPYPTLLKVLAAAAACAAFALLNNGGWFEALTVGIAVAAGQGLRMLLARARTNEFLTVFLAAVTALVVFTAVSAASRTLGGDTAQDAALTSAVLFLVPGFPLVTGALDLARLDLNAGTIRVVYACLVLLATGTAVWAVAATFHSSPVTIVPPEFEQPLLSIVRFVAGAVGVIGFALLFSTPLRIALIAAVIGAVVNLGRLALVDVGLGAPIAAALAGLAVGVLAFTQSRWLSAPRVTLTVPAVLIMVPGAASYRAIVAMIDGDTVPAIQYGVEAVSVVVALAIGLTVARILTEREWGSPRI
ncbi:threonine/serine exporter ThrE family protein [Microbacterium fluvii]|uniref:Threonine/serine exporter ThrE family protein n=1 Tax=Microbacterium fluvii TaxID=415215 RepID=A0ABW2H8K0_9MICO|nr:threonine/serine exporter family protein [Microbacterium fluvii]MCU4671294.1 threonine/serine exporter family protein [Microbacterium fluvii]